jgi:hypothetical protein
MSYSINLTNGSQLVPGGLTDGTVDTSHSSLTLIGKDYAGYGQFLNENFVYLLENFANQSSPSTPLAGQLWWDTTNNILRVWSGASWKISTGATSSPASSPPGDLSSLGGDLWFDTTNSQLKVYTGTQWIVIGPVAASSLGNSGAIPVVITDTSSATHICIELLLSGVPYAIISKDIFTTSQVAGFSSIIAGLNFATVNPPLGLNTQSVIANPNTLVQRDNTGSIVANNAVVTNLTASTIAATGVISSAAGFQGNITATHINTGTITVTTVLAPIINTTTVNATTVNAPTINTYNLGVSTGLQVGAPYPGAPGVTNLYGTAYYNGSQIATVGGAEIFSSINATVIGNVIPASGAFTTLQATGTSSLNGLLLSAQIAPTPTANVALNLGASNAWWLNTYSANYVGTTLTVPTIWSTTIGATTVNATTANATTLNAPTIWSTTVNATTITATTLNATTLIGGDTQVSSFGVGTAPSGTAGEIRATNNITAYYSDKRLKNVIGNIDNALNKVCSLNGVIYTSNELAATFGYISQEEQVGVLAQEVAAVQPQVVTAAPFDIGQNEDGTEFSLSGEHYQTVRYERLVPLLIEAIKELKADADIMRAELAHLRK